MERLENLRIDELIALYENCPIKDESKIVAEIEKRTGINITERSLLVKIAWWLIGISFSFIILVWFAAGVKLLMVL